MNFLSLFVLIPIFMLCGLLISGNMKQIRIVCATGASMLLLLAATVTVLYLGERNNGNTAEMLFTASAVWYSPLNIHYSVGVDGISVAMLLLSSIIVFTGIFTSWKMEVHAQRIFYVVLFIKHRSIRVLHFDGSFYHVYVLRNCLNSDVSLDWYMGNR